MPDYHLCLSTSRRYSTTKYVVLDEDLSRSNEFLVDRTLDTARCLESSKYSGTGVQFEPMTTYHYDEYGYRAILYSRRGGERRILAKGDVKLAVGSDKAKNKALKNLLERAGGKVEQEMRRLSRCETCGRSG